MSNVFTRQKIVGFTIIELLVTIVVIGVLAGIVSISYSSWRINTAKSEVSSDLNSVSAAMESYRTFNGSYSLTMPTSYVQSPNVTTFLKTATTTNYCAQATSTAVPSVVYNITNTTRTPAAGACP